MARLTTAQNQAKPSCQKTLIYVIPRPKRSRRPTSQCVMAQLVNASTNSTCSICGRSVVDLLYNQLCNKFIKLKQDKMSFELRATPLLLIKISHKTADHPSFYDWICLCWEVRNRRLARSLVNKQKWRCCVW